MRALKEDADRMFGDMAVRLLGRLTAINTLYKLVIARAIFKITYEGRFIKKLINPSY